MISTIRRAACNWKCELVKKNSGAKAEVWEVVHLVWTTRDFCTFLLLVLFCESYTGEKTDLCKTQQLTPQQSRWTNSSTEERKNCCIDAEVNGPFEGFVKNDRVDRLFSTVSLSPLDLGCPLCQRGSLPQPEFVHSCHLGLQGGRCHPVNNPLLVVAASCLRTDLGGNTSRRRWRSSCH